MQPSVAETGGAAKKTRIVITIDGPAGAGKSTVARELARRLGFQYLDTGAMYRAATLAVLRQGLIDAPPEKVAELVRNLDIRLEGDRVFLNGEDVTTEIRSSHVTEAVRVIASNPLVRQEMVRLQRAAGERQNLVAEGRDQGTVVFPDAAIKFYLTADLEERARRRLQDLQRLGEQLPFEKVLEDIRRRDEADMNRQVSPLRIPQDAEVIDTTNLSIEQVVDRMMETIRRRLDDLPCDNEGPAQQAFESRPRQ